MKEIINYLHKIYGVDANTAATIVISLIVFFLGYLIAFIGKSFVAYFNKGSFQKSMAITLNDFQQSCALQASSVSDSLQRASILLNNDFFIQSITIASLPYLHNLDLHILLNNYRRPFISDKKIRAISRMVALIAEIHSMHQEMDQSTAMFNAEVIRNQEEYTRNLNYLRRYNDSLTLRGHIGFGSQMERDYALAFHSIFDVWREAGSSTKLKDTYSQLVNPIRELTEKYPLVIDAIANNDFALAADKGYINLEKIEGILQSKCAAVVERHWVASVKTKRLNRVLGQKWSYYQIQIATRKLKLLYQKAIKKFH